MSDDEFHMTYPCYFLCGNRGGLVCINVNGVDCVCFFTEVATLQAFERSQRLQLKNAPDIPMQVAFIKCDDRDELISRLIAAKRDLAATDVQHLAINPITGQPIAFIGIADFVAALRADES